jgi:hypothetical protein
MLESSLLADAFKPLFYAPQVAIIDVVEKVRT